GEGERGDDPDDEGRPVAHTELQVLARDPGRSAHGQSRRALPVRWRNTAWRLGSNTSPPEMLAPVEETQASNSGRSFDASSARTSKPESEGLVSWTPSSS